MKRFDFYAFALCFIIFVCCTVVMHAKSGAAIQDYILVPSFRPFDTASINKYINEGDRLVWTNADSAIKLFTQAEQISRQQGYADGIVSALVNKAHAYTSLGKYDSSYEVYTEAVGYCCYCKKKTFLSRIYTDMATTYLLQSDYTSASSFYYKSLKEQEDNGFGESANILFTYANLAYLEGRLGEQEKAIEYLSTAEKIARKKQYHGHLGFILNNKGEAYSALKQHEKAYACFIEGLSHCAKDTLLSVMQRTEITQSLYISIGALQLQEKNYVEAISFLRKGMSLSNKTSPYFTSIFPNYLLGKAYLHLKKYDSAQNCLVPALEKATAMSFREDMPEAMSTLASVYEGMGNYEGALAMQKKFMQLSDSLVNLEKLNENRKMEMKYITAQKNEEIARKKLLISSQNNQLMRKNTWLLVCSITMLVLLVCCLLILMRYRNNQSQQRLQEARLKTIEQEMELVAHEKDLLKRDEKLRVMQALIQGEEKERQRLAKELHDGIGGMLAAVQMQFYALRNNFSPQQEQQRMDCIDELLNETAREIRVTAHNLVPDVVLKHSLKEALQLFVANINIANALYIDLQVHQLHTQIDKTAELYIYRIVQELIQNIIKHAGATEATIQISQKGETLIILTEDNGAGFDMSKQYNGLGLKNLKSRVQAFQGEFSIDSSPGMGTTSYIELNLFSLNPQSI